MPGDHRSPSDMDLGVRTLKQAAKSLKETPLSAELPKPARFSPTYQLIRMHHMQSGATRWDREKFRRLCVAFDETEEEMGMRIGLAPSEVRARLLGRKFSVTEGILLQLHWEFIQEFRTGVKPEGSALAPKPCPRRHELGSVRGRRYSCGPQNTEVEV